MKAMLAAACLAALTMPAMAADFTVLHMYTDVAAPVDKAWDRIGKYCDITNWLDLPCQITAGNGDVGTVRRVAGAISGTIDEMMVSKTRHSYGFVIMPSPIQLHGSLSAEPIDATHTRLEYMLIYDQSTLPTPQAQAADREKRRKMFTGALARMKEIVEKP